MQELEESCSHSHPSREFHAQGEQASKHSSPLDVPHSSSTTITCPLWLCFASAQTFSTTEQGLFVCFKNPSMMVSVSKEFEAQSRPAQEVHGSLAPRPASRPCWARGEANCPDVQPSQERGFLGEVLAGPGWTHHIQLIQQPSVCIRVKGGENCGGSERSAAKIQWQGKRGTEKLRK